jgi:hypothetical protein
MEYLSFIAVSEENIAISAAILTLPKVKKILKG